MLKIPTLTISLLFAGLLACQDVDEPESDVTIPPFESCMGLDGNVDRSVEVQGGEFILDGELVVPHGVNSYPLLQHIGRNRLDAVQDIFDQAIDLGRPLVRTNAFMDGGDSSIRCGNCGSIRGCVYEFNGFLADGRWRSVAVD